MILNNLSIIVELRLLMGDKCSYLNCSTKYNFSYGTDRT